MKALKHIICLILCFVFISCVSTKKSRQRELSISKIDNSLATKTIDLNTLDTSTVTEDINRKLIDSSFTTKTRKSADTSLTIKGTSIKLDVAVKALSEIPVFKYSKRGKLEISKKDGVVSAKCNYDDYIAQIQFLEETETTQIRVIDEYFQKTQSQKKRIEELREKEQLQNQIIQKLQENESFNKEVKNYIVSGLIAIGVGFLIIIYIAYRVYNFLRPLS